MTKEKEKLERIPKLRYAREQFRNAMYSLTETGSQREQVISAYRNNIIHIREQDVPEIGKELKVLKKNLTHVSPRSIEGSVKATVTAMTDSDVIKIIQDIIDLYDKIAAEWASINSRPEV
jgi:uncharacterized protein YaaN involved in tellurite resistance